MSTCLTCARVFEPLCFGDPDCLACNRAERIKVLEAQVARLESEPSEDESRIEDLEDALDYAETELCAAQAKVLRYKSVVSDAESELEDVLEHKENLEAQVLRLQEDLEGWECSTCGYPIEMYNPCRC